jgi:hypothetical protein
LSIVPQTIQDEEADMAEIAEHADLDEIAQLQKVSAELEAELRERLEQGEALGDHVARLGIVLEAVRKDAWAPQDIEGGEGGVGSPLAESPSVTVSQEIAEQVDEMINSVQIMVRALMLKIDHLACVLVPAFLLHLFGSP